MRRLVLILTGIAVVLIIIIGGIAAALIVGGDGNDDSEPTAGETPPPREEGELRLFGPDPLTLDPACATDIGSARYIVEIFSGLVTLDKDTLKPVADIAESWDISADGTVYTFHLRRGVLFHDRSRRVTATDFKYSMERALAPQTLSNVAVVYLGDIVGAQEFARGEAEEIRGIRIPNPDDPFTLEITIDAPKPYFLAKLTYPTAFVVDQREVGNATCFQRTDWQLQPNGSGPFQLQEWRLGQRIVLVPHIQYHGEPKPALTRVTFLLAGGSPLTMYENEEVDVSGVGINDIERIRDPNEPLNKEFVEKPSLDTFYISFNVEKPPFDDVSVRQAFATTIDKATLVRVVLRDLAQEAKGILPPEMPGYNGDLAGLPFDRDRARQLLAESRYAGNLPPIILITGGQGGAPDDVVQAVQEMWRQNLGVDVTIEQRESALFFQELDAGNYQISSLGWIADYVDPQNFLEIKFFSENIGTTNESRYRNGDVDDLLRLAQTEQNETARFDLYRRAEEIIVNEAAWIPLFHGKSSALVKPYVQGYSIPPLIIPTLKYVSISQ